MSWSHLLLKVFLWQFAQVKSNWPSKRLVLGHRGARAQAPENTLPSFKLAMQLGADGIEFDVFLSKDKIPVVIHDDTLERTTDGVGNVWDKLVNDLQMLNAAKGWPDTGVFLPTLKQTLDMMPDNAVVNIELKGEGSYSKNEFAEVVLETIRDNRSRLFIVVSSFDAKLLKIVRKKDAKLHIGFLLDDEDWRYLPSLTYINAIRPNALHVRYKLVSPKIVSLAHKKGLRVLVWTVNDPNQAKSLFDAGVDGIFSDLPKGQRIIETIA